MNSKFDLTGKVAVVTGATSELGREAARAYARAGADLALISEDAQGLFELKIEIEEMGARALALQCALTGEANVKAAVEEILGAFGKIDILFNNSGLALRGGLEEMTERDWGIAFGEVLTGVYLTGKHIIPAMQRTGGGRIVNVSSASARIPAENGHWAISPADMVANLTKRLARLYIPYGVTINTIAPEKVLHSALGLEGTILSLSTDGAGLVRRQFVGADRAAVA